MFAGAADSESVFSGNTVTLQRSKSAVQPSSSRRKFHSNNPFLDPVEAAARVSLIEEEFGWSGSVGGIRGRDDRQIERDVEYERQMAERTRKRHERKLAKQQQILGNSSSTPSSLTSANKTEKTGRRPVFAPTPNDLCRVNELTPGQPDAKLSPTNQNLNRGKSLRDKVEAALGRWNSVNPKKCRPRSVSALDPRAVPHGNDSPMVERREGLGALARRISKKITIEDQERRRRERLDMAYAEPPVLSHTLVGPASPFPMRPALSTLVPTSHVKYGEAHTDFSPNPFRRRPNKEDATKPKINREKKETK